MHAARPPRHRPPPPRAAAGFTLIELVMVITLVGVLALLVLPRTLDLPAWQLRAFSDTLRAEMATAQRLSLQQRRPIVATLNANGVLFAYADGTALLALPCPAWASPCIAEPGPRSFTFNHSHSGRHRSASGSSLPVTLASGDTAWAWVLEDETGLFRPAP
jgi:prepilin-type N-terminal cleavage/methylation domain-containing protein